MSKKQNNRFNYFLIISLLILSFPLSSFGEEKGIQLRAADSLFQLQKYTESFEVYEQILDDQKYASPQMLMKMAFIKEGLGDNSYALYYLNEYYLETSDKKAQTKMNELAEENDLVGYAVSDYNLFRGLVNKYYLQFNLLIFGAVLFLVTIIVYRKFKSKSNATPYAISVVVLLLLFFWVINFELVSKEGILIDNHAYLMTGPSAGADLVEIVQKGHKLVILDEEGIWLKVDWNGQEVYIRSSKVKRVS